MDIIFNSLQTNGSIHILKFADFFFKNKFAEKAILLYVKVGQHQKAYFLAKKHNFPHLFPQIEKEFKEKNFEILRKRALKRKDKEERKSLLVKRDTTEVMDLFDSQNWDEFMKQLQDDKQSVTWNFYEKIKELEFERKKEVLEFIAKKWAHQGDYDNAVKAFLDIQDNVQVMKTLIK